MLQKLSFILLALSIPLGLSYFIHSQVLGNDLQGNEFQLLKFSYLFNFAFSYLLLSNFVIFQKKLLGFIGFIFLGSGVMKFGLFFFLARSSNYELGRSNFLLFFVPFVICLLVEIFYITRVLNRANFNKNN